MKYRWCVRTMPEKSVFLSFSFFFSPLPFFFFYDNEVAMPADIESRMKYRGDRGKINSRPLFEGMDKFHPRFLYRAIMFKN